MKLGPAMEREMRAGKKIAVPCAIQPHILPKMWVTYGQYIKIRNSRRKVKDGSLPNCDMREKQMKEEKLLASWEILQISPAVAAAAALQPSM
jgi:hypothetical protein